MMRTHHRRTAAWSGVALVAGLLTLLGPAAPAQAAGCQSEVPTPLPPSACDDVTPPDTVLFAEPEPDPAGWTRTSSITFTFAAVSTDPADTDELGLECRLQGPSQAHEWRACESPLTYEALADTVEGETYTFAVRAFDVNDRAIVFDDPNTPPPPLGDPDVEVPDEDPTPATRTWRQDSKPPRVSLHGGPYDAEGTGWPITSQPRVTYLLRSDEAGTSFRCQLDGRQTDCAEGTIRLRGLSGGDHVLTATAADAAGNEDPTPAVKQFVVPYNLTGGRFWKTKRAKGYFSGDVLQTRRAGARVKFKATNIREFLLIAPAGRKYGEIRVRTGTGYWKTYDLSEPSRTKRHRYVIRDAKSPLFSGRILIESISRKKPVRVDALVFPPTS